MENLQTRIKIQPIWGKSAPVLRLLVSSDVSAAQFLHQNTNDADKQNEVDLEAGRQETY